MKKVFELAINGKISQYLLPSEIRLLKWDDGKVYTLTSVKVTNEFYFRTFGKN